MMTKLIFEKTKENTTEGVWNDIEAKWLDLYRNRKTETGFSVVKKVNAKDEWLCEAYMKTDYSKLSEEDFQQTLNNYLAYLMKEGKIYET